MNKKQTMMVALAGAALMAASQVQAQLTGYNDEDLMLLFRNSSTTTGNDAVVDLGKSSSFISQVTGDGGSVVLDTGTGFTATAGFNSFTSAGLVSAVGSINQIGMSAVAEFSDTGDGNTLWLSRVVTSGQGSSAGRTHSRHGQWLGIGNRRRILREW